MHFIVTLIAFDKMPFKINPVVIPRKINDQIFLATACVNHCLRRKVTS